MSHLKIQILGPPNIYHDDQIVQVNRQIPRAILYYLAAEPGVTAREKLLDLFWPDQDPERARTRLREALSRLRSSIPDPALIQATPEVLWLDKNRSQVDLDHYWRLLESAGTASWSIPDRTPIPHPIATALEQAAYLWHGHYLLEGARLPSTPAFDEWLTTSNAQLIEQQVRVLGRLATHAIASGNLMQAVEYIQFALEFDPLDEELVFQFISLRLELGQVQQARKAYEDFSALLLREMGMPPGPQLVALSQRINKPVRWRDSHLETTLNLHPTLELPYIGRADVFLNMEQALQRGGLFYLQGPAGSGKSRLLQEFTRRRKGGYRILVARCRPNDSLLPLQSLIDTLRLQIRPDEWGSLPAPWLEYLSIWIPELQEQLTERVMLPQANQQRAAQEAMRRLMFSLQQDRKLILIVDDIQWADEATIQTLAYLLDRPPFETGALLILSGRGDYPNPYLESWLSVLIKDLQITTAELPGLSLAETHELCQAAFRKNISEAFANQMYAKTAGNPYFILETIRSMLENNLQTAISFPAIPTPATISSLLHTRLRQVSLLGGKFLTIAAVFGREFIAADVSKVCEFTAIQTARVLEELEKRALIEPHPVKKDHYQFVHDYIVETALDSLYPARRAALHEQVLSMLETRYADDLGPIAALLAEHAELAGDGPQAFDYWLLAGKNAWRMFFLEKTFMAFERADQLIDQYHAQIKVDQIYQLYSEWNDAAFESNAPEKLLVINQRLLDLGEQFQAPLLTGTALDGLSDAYMALNRFEEGLEYAEQAVRVLEYSTSQFEYCEAQQHRGVICYMLNRLYESDAIFDSLLKKHPWEDGSVKSLQSRSNLHYQTALVKTLRGKPALGRLHGFLALEFSKRSKHPHNQVAAHNVLAFASHFSGNFAFAIQQAEAGINLAEKLHASRMQGYLYSSYAMTQLLYGRIDASFAAAAAARRLGEDFGQYETISISHRLEGDVYAFLQLWDKAVEAYQRGLESGREGFWALDNMYHLGAATAMQGRAEAGLELMQQAIHIARQSGLGLIEHMASGVLSYVLLSVGQLENAERYATQVLQDTEGICIPAVKIGSLASLAFCAGVRGDSQNAVTNFQQAYQFASRLGDFWLERLVLALIQGAAEFMDRMPFPAEFVADRLSILQSQLLSSTTNPELHRAIQSQIA